MQTSRLRRLAWPTLAALALALAGGIAYAKTMDSGAAIKACAKSGDGQLRLDTGGGCLPSEQAVQWNQVGPPGPPGNTDTTVRNATGFISIGQTASSPVLSGAGQLGTLSFTCGAFTYTTNTADTNTFEDRVLFYSPQVPASPLGGSLFGELPGDHLTVPWGGATPIRTFQVFIEGETGSQTHVTFTTITGYERDYPQYTGCTYYAYVQTSDVPSQQTVTP